MERLGGLLNQFAKNKWSPSHMEECMKEIASRTRSADPPAHQEGLCAVSAHPDLQDRIRAALAAAAAYSTDEHDIVKEMIQAQFPVRVGLNDNVIYPSETIGAGRAPAAAPERVPRGAQKVIVVLVNFQDRTISQSAQHYRDLFFATGTGSV